MSVSIQLSIRVIPFSVDDAGLDVAIIDTASELLIPRGSLEPNETLADAASRVAFEALGVEPDYLEQLYTFSVSHNVVEVIVAYFALLSADTRHAIERNPRVVFFSVENDSALSEVDRSILEYATIRLRSKLGYSNIGFYLLPREFTLSELQDAYESVIGAPLDKRNFRRRMIASRILEPLGTKRPTNHRPAALYRFVGGDLATGALTPAETDWST